MFADIFTFAPYFRNGLLFFPEKTISALMEVGLDRHIGHRATSGLSLDDNESLEELTCAIDALLSRVDSTSPFFTALASDEAYFMLTGKPVTR